MKHARSALPYLGTISGTATFQVQIAGNAAYDQIGWYNVQNPTSTGLIFKPGTTVGATAAFTPSEEYGLFL